MPDFKDKESPRLLMRKTSGRRGRGKKRKESGNIGICLKRGKGVAISLVKG